jgi:hypothetical protein
MSANKRPSTSSLRRYLTSRPYVSVADIRRRFGLDPDAMSLVRRNGTTVFVGLPEREATKLQDLWDRDEVGVELSVEVKAPVIVGIYPMRIARFVIDQTTFANPDGHGNGWHPPRWSNGEPPRPEPAHGSPGEPPRFGDPARGASGEPPRTGDLARGVPGEPPPAPHEPRHPE